MHKHTCVQVTGILCFNLGSFGQVEINHAAEVHEIFDSISYRKGASIIRMLQSYLGAECFQVGSLILFFFFHTILERYLMCVSYSSIELLNFG